MAGLWEENMKKISVKFVVLPLMVGELYQWIALLILFDKDLAHQRLGEGRGG